MAEKSDIKEKYRLAVQALQAISQRSGRDPKEGYVDEWTQASAFIDCRLAERNTLKRLGEPMELENKRYTMGKEG